MKKLFTAAVVVLVTMAACNNGSKTETTATDTTAKPMESTEATEAQKRAKEISDSTTMLDKKLADPNSKYSPDSLK